MTEQKLSTSQLAKKRGINAKQLFSDLKRAGYINRGEDGWVLTEIGAKFGGEYRQHTKFGKFIVWPDNLLIDDTLSSGKQLSATQLGERLNLNAKRVNQLLSELGWIKKNEQGWQVTPAGLTHGAQQKTDRESQQLFVLWHDTITRNKRLKQTVIEYLGQDANAKSTDKSFSSFQQKFAAKHRTLDGHYVRSRAELIIDNWLYMNGIVHAYDRQLPIEEDQLSDFYLPSGKVYLQYWGDDNGPASERDIERIKQLYQQHQFSLIEIFSDDIEKLDHVLPSRLREFGIKAY
ncbi:glycerol kinase [Vibrio sp. 404]|uniref:Glycerol kinase n=1 Tax=Vibrio marinisediminis TaxID=2758441 RepID=A0A7W2ISE1_9VIBR|nr:glycerol kinase [Vibrio marinisediminis]MBA5761047.1 glycerol kinase [Vibrio marinisediminis]